MATAASRLKKANDSKERNEAVKSGGAYTQKGQIRPMRNRSVSREKKNPR